MMWHIQKSVRGELGKVFRKARFKHQTMKKILLLTLCAIFVLACSETHAMVTALTSEAPTPSRTASPASLPTCLVATGVENGALNVRACAGIQCPVLRVAREGDRFEVFGEANGWLNIGEGWVNAQFCRKDGYE